MKIKLKKKKAIRDQFVLTVGDEGAIFCYYDDGKLANKLFMDSPTSQDVKLMEKLLVTYPKVPIYMLVDVIEQNYSQQVLPPVSSFGIRQQVQRRIKRDFQPNDFTNVFFLNRSKEGRKDWNFLFISLANSDPFAKWLEVVLSYDNPFMGVYLLPLESTRLVEEINKSLLEAPTQEWELLVLHNKVGGFRIVALKNGKLIFTRLAQNLMGENIPEIIVGNMEQEISNTVEYLRRLAFKGEADSKITIIAGTDVLQKVDVKTLKFGSVNLYTPFDVAQKLNLPQSVTEKDKFADILTSTHFAAHRKHVLKFNSPLTKRLENFYNYIRGAYIAFALALITLIGFSANEVLEISEGAQEKEAANINLKQIKAKTSALQAKKSSLPPDIDKLLDIMAISNLLPVDKFQTIRILEKITPQFNENRMVDSIKMTVEKGDVTKKAPPHFTMEVGMHFIIDESNKDVLATIADSFLKDFQKLLPKYVVKYTTEPKIEQSQFEKVTVRTTESKATISVPAKIAITGEL